MAHFGRLGSYRFAEDVGDIRAANVYGRDGEKLGKIDDVIFDHDTMEVQYVVVDSGGWFEAGRFLLPADRMSAKELHKDDFSADATKEPVKSSRGITKNRWTRTVRGRSIWTNSRNIGLSRR